MRPSTHVHASTETSGGPTDTTLADLEALLGRAAGLDLADPAWRELSADARQVTNRLADSARLDRALVVGDADPPVVVTRLLVRSWLRLVSRAAAARAGGAATLRQRGAVSAGRSAR